MLERFLPGIVAGSESDADLLYLVTVVTVVTVQEGSVLD